MLNAIRRFFPDWLVPDPSVDDLISTFERTRRELREQSERFFEKSSSAEVAARELQTRAENFKSEGVRARAVAQKIEALLS